MNFNDKEIELFKEIGINIENKEYTKEEQNKLLNNTLEYIMSSSKKEIPIMQRKFDTILNKLT